MQDIVEKSFQQRQQQQPLLIGLSLAVLGGLATFLAAPAYSLWPLVFLGIAAFALIALSNSPLRAALLSFLWAGTYFFALFDWITIAAGTPIARIVLAFVLSLYFGVIGWIWALIFSPYRNFTGSRQAKALNFFPLLGTISLASFVWLGGEQLRMSFPLGGMPWGNIAFSLTDSPLLKLARFGSTQLIQFFALLIGIGLAFAWYALKRKRIFVCAALGFMSAALVVAPFGIPNLKLDGPHLSALIVQGNAPESFGNYLSGERALEITENHVALTAKTYDDQVDLIIWPESASDRDLRTDLEAGAAFSKTVDLIGKTPILLGTQEYSADEQQRTNDYLLFVDGAIAGKYSKQHPVPFGEYVPWRETIGKYFTQIEQISSDMIPGKTPARIEVTLKQPIFQGTDENGEANPISRIVIGTPICFEVAFDDIVNQAASESDFLVFPTNNSSFGRSNQTAQQFAMARLRAVEHQKTAVQAAASGITGVIDANGVVAYETEIFTAAARTQKIELRKDPSFATQTYSYRVQLVYLLVAVGSCIGIIRYVRNR